jgi:small nuclear ribonucleoprotein (snRNP)-like protein
MLRDGRKIIGTMRSFDQFANVVLEHAFERVIVGKKFSDVPLGLYVIRGENVVLLGQLVRWLPWPGRGRSPRTHELNKQHMPLEA